MSVHWPIVRQLVLRPRQVAIVDEQRKWRNFELLAGALHIASEVERRSTADKIGLMLPTSGLFPIAALGAWMVGRSIVPLNYLLKPDDLQYVCDDSGIDTIITVQPMLDFLDRVPEGPNLLRLEDMNFKGVPEPRWPRLAGSDDLAALLYTSGTSARPKGVMLTHGNLRSNIQQCVNWAHFSRADSMMGVLPPFHSFGLTVLTLVPLTVGLPVYYTARFQPRRIMSLLEKYKPTAMIAIPSMYNALLNVKDADASAFSHMRYLVAGGEPLPDAVADAFEQRYGIRINEGYGLTETSPVTHWCRPHEFRRHSVGRAVGGVSVRIVSDDGEDCGPNVDGEIRLDGPNIMQGYYHLEEENRKVFDERGYFRTGDIGREDEDGFLFITGRLKEMMIIGGENVFPREIEEVLSEHREVSASAVIGVPDVSRGEVPVGYVEMVEGAAFDETALRSFCRETLPQYKVPREIHCLEELPRNPTGKILRRELSEQYLSKKAGMD